MGAAVGGQERQEQTVSRVMTPRPVQVTSHGGAMGSPITLFHA